MTDTETPTTAEAITETLVRFITETSNAIQAKRTEIGEKDWKFDYIAELASDGAALEYENRLWNRVDKDWLSCGDDLDLFVACLTEAQNDVIRDAGRDSAVAQASSNVAGKFTGLAHIIYKASLEGGE